MTECERIAGYVCQADWTSIAPEVKDKLKQHLLDSIGCALGAEDSSVMASIRREESGAACSGPCSVIGGGFTSPERAAFHNGALIRYLDYMDAFVAREEACHPSDNIAPLLTAAEMANSSGEEFLLALAIAYHVQCRMTDSSAPIMRAGFDHTLQLSVSIAAGASRLSGLNREQTAHAIALATAEGLSLGASSSGEHVPQWKRLASAASAFHAIHDVRLAHCGITGPLHAFEGPLGLKQALGKTFQIDWRNESYDGVLACSIKKYNAEFDAQSLIEGIVDLRNQGLRASNVREMTIDIFKAGYEMAGEGKSVNLRIVATKEDADRSLPYLAAVALLDGDVSPSAFTRERLNAVDVRRLVARIDAKPNRVYTLAYPKWLYSRVAVRCVDGRQLEIEKCDFEGFYTRPPSWEAVIEKFRLLGRPERSEDKLSQIVDCTWKTAGFPNSCNSCAKTWRRLGASNCGRWKSACSYKLHERKNGKTGNRAKTGDDSPSRQPGGGSVWTRKSRWSPVRR